MSKYNDVDEYIARADEKARPLLKALRQLILSTVPESEEGIGWNVPIYKYQGILAGFDTYDNHDFVTFGIDSLENEDRDTLNKLGYKTGSTTVQIKFNQEIPVKELEKLLRKQANINKSKGAQQDR